MRCLIVVQYHVRMNTYNKARSCALALYTPESVSNLYVTIGTLRNTAQVLKESPRL
jgi:hypothetical protein